MGANREGQESRKVGRSGPLAGWEPLDCVGYSWCDRDGDSTPPKGIGEVSVLARRGVVRLSVHPRTKWAPYDLTMPVDALERLIVLVDQALSP